MQKSLYIFSHILLIGTFAAGCKDIERDNILDPKNPNSFRPHVVTVEAFVNTSPELPYNYNDIMLEALEQLKTIYAAKIIVSHYHRDVQEYKDNYALFESDQLYDKYGDIRWTPNPDVTTVGDLWADALHEAYARQKSAEKALNDSAKRINRVMKKWRLAMGKKD